MASLYRSGDREGTLTAGGSDTGLTGQKPWGKRTAERGIFSELANWLRVKVIQYPYLSLRPKPQ